MRLHNNQPAKLLHFFETHKRLRQKAQKYVVEHKSGVV